MKRKAVSVGFGGPGPFDVTLSNKFCIKVLDDAVNETHQLSRGTGSQLGRHPLVLAVWSGKEVWRNHCGDWPPVESGRMTNWPI